MSVLKTILAIGAALLMLLGLFWFSVGMHGVAGLALLAGSLTLFMRETRAS
ncbi:MAG: hypothetical protein V5A23_01005 [Halobacteriales archaeon]